MKTVFKIDAPKTPIECELLLRPYKRGEKEITVGVCFELLQATNFGRTMRDMLMCIEKLPEEKRRGFEKVVPEAFRCREQPEAVVALGRELAGQGGYAERLEQALKPEAGEFYLSSPQAAKGLALVGGDGNFSDRSFGKYEKLKFANINRVRLDETCVDIPSQIEFQNCREAYFGECNFMPETRFGFAEGMDVYFFGIQNMPRRIDASCCNLLSLSHMTLADDIDFILKDGISLDLKRVENVPAAMPLGKCRAIKAAATDLGMVKNFCYKQGADLCFDGSNGLGQYRLPDADFMPLKKATFKSCLPGKQFKTMAFGDGAEVAFSLVFEGGMPAELDVRRCDSIGFDVCSLKQFNELILKDRAAVAMRNVVNMPEHWDFSRCREVELVGRNIALPRDFDVTNADKVVLKYIDMAGSQLLLKDGVQLELAVVKNVAGDLEKCSQLSCYQADLQWYDKLVCRSGSTHSFVGYSYGCGYSMPKAIDVCAAEKVVFNSDKYAAGLQKLICRNEAQFKDVVDGDLPEEVKIAYIGGAEGKPAFEAAMRESRGGR